MFPCRNIAWYMEHLFCVASEINRTYKTFVSSLHCALENGADLYVNERQKIRHYRVRSTEQRRMQNRVIFTSRSAYVNCVIIAMLYIHSIGNQPLNTVVVFKMRDSVPSVSYSSVCNVLRQWSISLIPTYRVYRLYDIVGIYIYIIIYLWDI